MIVRWLRSAIKQPPIFRAVNKKSKRNEKGLPTTSRKIHQRLSKIIFNRLLKQQRYLQQQLSKWGKQSWRPLHSADGSFSKSWYACIALLCGIFHSTPSEFFIQFPLLSTASLLDSIEAAALMATQVAALMHCLKLTGQWPCG